MALGLGLRLGKKGSVLTGLFSFRSVIRITVIQVRMTSNPVLKAGWTWIPLLKTLSSQILSCLQWRRFHIFSGNPPTLLPSQGFFFITRISHVATCAHYLLLFFSPEESGFTFSPLSGSWRVPLRLIWTIPVHPCRVSTQSLCSVPTVHPLATPFVSCGASNSTWWSSYTLPSMKHMSNCF